MKIATRAAIALTAASMLVGGAASASLLVNDAPSQDEVTVANNLATTEQTAVDTYAACVTPSPMCSEEKGTVSVLLAQARQAMADQLARDGIVAHACPTRPCIFSTIKPVRQLPRNR